MSPDYKKFNLKSLKHPQINDNQILGVQINNSIIKNENKTLKIVDFVQISLKYSGLSN